MRYIVYEPINCNGSNTKKAVAGFKTALELSNIKYQLVSKIEDIQKFDVVFCYFGSDFDNGKLSDTKDCSIQISSHIAKIENMGATCYPNSYLMQFYENKKKLFELFKCRNIKIPNTFYVPTEKLYMAERKNIQDILPCVIKFCYSCGSKLMDQAFTIEELDNKLKNIYSKNVGEFIIQKKIKFTKEARLSYVNDNIFHGYYRLKSSNEDLSGATRFGSLTDFNIDLSKYTDFIKDFIKKTNFYIGGIDICWENDNLDEEPYVLEVSHYYEINPPTSNDMVPYKKFKYSAEYRSAQQSLYNLMAHKLLEFAMSIESRKIMYCDIDCTISDSETRIKKYSANHEYQKYDKVVLDIPIADSVEALDVMFHKYKIVFITSRNLFPDGIESTKTWLLHNRFNYYSIIFTNSAEEKIKFFDNEKEYVFIDDLTTNHHILTCDDTKTIHMLNTLKINYIKFDKEKNNWKRILELL
jgi:glutathione synthase/RimK-type ligase-like ATP-grasp enzyme